MTTPFPGMDPYLEHPALWEDVHTRLIVAIALPLNQLLHDLYDRAGYDQILNYGQPPVPPLTDTDAAWATTLIRA